MMLRLECLGNSARPTIGIDVSYWNQGYNKRKQEEQRTKDDKPLKPLYRDTFKYSRDSSSSSYQKRHIQQQHDKFCWYVGAGVIVILTGVFIWVMIKVV